MSSKKFQPESVHLGATLIAQASGDVSKARRAATHAAGWLESVDPDFKSAPVQDDEAIAAALALADSATADLAEAQAEAKAFRDAIISALPDALVKRANGDLVEAVRLLVDVAERLRVQAQAPKVAPAPVQAPATPPKLAVVKDATPATPATPATDDGMVPEDDARIPAHVKGNRALLLFQRRRLWAADQAAAAAID